MKTHEQFKRSSLTANQTDSLSTSNNSVLSTTKDLINVSLQTGKLYQIENSVDITLHERDLKFRVSEKKEDELSETNMCSFSLDDNEKEGQSAVFCERTRDFLRDLQGNNPNVNGPENIGNSATSACAGHMSEVFTYFFFCCVLHCKREMKKCKKNKNISVLIKMKKQLQIKI